MLFVLLSDLGGFLILLSFCNSFSVSIKNKLPFLSKKKRKKEKKEKKKTECNAFFNVIVAHFHPISVDKLNIMIFSVIMAGME